MKILPAGYFRCFAACLVAAALCAAPATAAKVKGKDKPHKISPEARALMAAGIDDLDNGQLTAAISQLNKAARTQPSVSAYFLLGWAHYQRGFKHGSVELADRDDAQSAIDAYRMALDMDPMLGELTDPTRLHFSLALCQEVVGEYEQALNSYKTALKLSPQKALIPLHAARLRLKMKDEEKSLSNIALAMTTARKSDHQGALIAAAKREPAFAPLLADDKTRTALGISQAESAQVMIASSLDARGEEMRDALNDPPRTTPSQDPAVVEKIAKGDAEFKVRHYLDAANAYTKALELNASRQALTAERVAELQKKIGTSYNKMGQLEQAILALQKSLQSNPKDPGTYYQIALSYAMSGKTAAAVNSLRDSFAVCTDPAELRRLVLLAKTDVEFEAARDLQAFAQLMSDMAERVALR